MVVSIRGTSSLRDAVTDAVGQPLDIDAWLGDEMPVCLCLHKCTQLQHLARPCKQAQTVQPVFQRADPCVRLQSTKASRAAATCSCWGRQASCFSPCSQASMFLCLQEALRDSGPHMAHMGALTSTAAIYRSAFCSRYAAAALLWAVSRKDCKLHTCSRASEAVQSAV